MKQTYDEMTLDAKQIAEVALYIYEKWEEAMKPPLLIFIPFKEWVTKLKDSK